MRRHCFGMVIGKGHVVDIQDRSRRVSRSLIPALLKSVGGESSWVHFQTSLPMFSPHGLFEFPQ